MLFRSLVAAAALLVALPAAAQDSGAAIQTAAAAFVKPTNAERMAVIVDQLTAAGLPHEVQTFEGGNQRTGPMAGSNVVVTLGDGPKDIVLTAHYDAVMDLNARSVLAASTAAIPHLKKEGGGFIINTTSIAARNGASGGAGIYGSAKAFVANVTRGMAKELIAYDIRVNAVAPGVILTPFHERYSTAQQLEAQLATVPQKRFGTPEDCVGAYLFLASKTLSGYMIGQTLEVNGGQLMP
ncbi:SDR family oxidoreductase [Brevundimonas sp.]|uniref:SDR family NAD(P)-dependent oxidoreductase n=1 Tax=Brevundimonas sp. TaxID=1871086 RepID=UPI001986EBBB|nr:SDR family oxidoreductase [Brevundimonas sp.]MBD3838438.1 SDR family oxidoreductase [Brevundimonas sp.]